MAVPSGIMNGFDPPLGISSSAQPPNCTERSPGLKSSIHSLVNMVRGAGRNSFMTTAGISALGERAALVPPSEPSGATAGMSKAEEERSRRAARKANR